MLQHLQEISPDSVDYVIAQTFYTYYILKDYPLAYELATRALARAPSDTGIIQIRSWIARRMGDFEAVVESMRLARRLEPDHPAWAQQLPYNLLLLHRYDEASAEIEAYEGRDQIVEAMRVALDLRQHGDLQRTAQDMIDIHEEFGTPFSYGLVIFAHQVTRDFEAAARAAEAIPDTEITPAGLPDQQMTKLEIWHFLGDQDKVAELARNARAAIDLPGIELSEIGDQRAMTLAILAAAEGDAESAERFIQQYFRGDGTDWAVRPATRDRACRILGMAGAADAAVKCIRDGLAEPSRIMPFFEPRLPHYDAIRQEPAFVDLVAELEE
jgi:tetratricopeptide (TPR) repeat protein